MKQDDSIVMVKKAAAITNEKSGKLDQQIAQAIIQACDEILDGNLRDQFIVDAIQGGAGTSANMNANEVIANRAIEILGGTKGDYSIVHPNDHVNMSQSTNDVIPTAGKITVLKLLPQTIKELEKLEKEMAQWKEQDEDVLSYALFPQVATDFFKYRAAQKNKIDLSKADVENGAYPV